MDRDLDRGSRGHRGERRRTGVHRRHRHRQPAGDHPAVGGAHRGERRQRHRLAGPPHRGAVRGGARRRLGAGAGRYHRPADRPLFLQHQVGVAAGPRRCRAPCRGGRTALRHGRQLSHLASHQGRIPRHGRHQCLADPAIRHRHPGVERAPARGLRHTAFGAAGSPRLRRRFRGRRCRVVRRPDADPRRGRRPAGGTRRPGLLHAGHDQEHLRHRLLPDRQYRRRARPLRGAAADHRRLPRGRHADVRHRRQHLQRRGGDQVVARPGGLDRDRRRYRGRRPAHRRRHGRRVRGAGVHRPGRAALAAGRARPGHRLDARHGCRRDRHRHLEERGFPRRSTCSPRRNRTASP